MGSLAGPQPRRHQDTKTQRVEIPGQPESPAVSQSSLVSSGLWVLAISAALRAARTDLFHRAQAHGLGFRAAARAGLLLAKVVEWRDNSVARVATMERPLSHGTAVFPDPLPPTPDPSVRAKPALCDTLDDSWLGTWARLTPVIGGSRGEPFDTSASRTAQDMLRPWRGFGSGAPERQTRVQPWCPPPRIPCAPEFASSGSVPGS
jgi:hypothetical protein